MQLVYLEYIVVLMVRPMTAFNESLLVVFLQVGFSEQLHILGAGKLNLNVLPASKITTELY
jgi:hypothetical protein